MKSESGRVCIDIAECINQPPEAVVSIRGWVVRLRDHGSLSFIDIEDRGGELQCVVSEKTEIADEDRGLIRPESALELDGQIVFDRGGPELKVTRLSVVGKVHEVLSPAPRTADLRDHRLTDHQLSNRHMYMRNPGVRAAMLIRHEFLGFFHQWFRDHDFIDFSAPVLTAVPLYHDASAMDLELHGEEIFLTQCVGFYLEAAIYGLDRVYNLGPSFRAEESKSKRHLMEYWHIKAELTYVDREDLMALVEDLVSDAVSFSHELEDLVAKAGGTGCPPLSGGPFPRIAYREAIEILRRDHDIDVDFGQSLGSVHEEALASKLTGPFWIVGNARSVEPFPYVIDPDDNELTMTADLIAPSGYGELLGIAEKIADLDELDLRMAEKGRQGDERYEWVRELRTLGSVPHGGFGMGFERFLRWVVGVEHVRDFAGFPRAFGRRVHP